MSVLCVSCCAQNQVFPPLWLQGAVAIQAAIDLDEAQPAAILDQGPRDDDELPLFPPLLHWDVTWIKSMNCDQCGRVTGNKRGRCSDCHLQYGAPQNENTQAGDNVYCNGHHLM